jgi:hypothetical protein
MIMAISSAALADCGPICIVPTAPSGTSDMIRLPAQNSIQQFVYRNIYTSAYAVGVTNLYWRGHVFELSVEFHKFISDFYDRVIYKWI